MKVATCTSIAVFFLLLCISSICRAEEVLFSSFQNSTPKYINIDSGVCIDVLHELSLKLKKHDIFIKPLTPDVISLKRTLSQLSNHQIDIFCGLSKSKNREQFIDYIDIPLYEVEEVFVKRRSDPFQYSDALSLTGKSIVVIRGSQTARKMRLLSKVKLYQVESVEQMFKLVASGRADLAFYHSLAIKYQLAQLEGRDKLERLQKSYATKKHYMVINKQISISARKKITSILRGMANDGTLAKILKRYQPNDDT